MRNLNNFCTREIESVKPLRIMSGIGFSLYSGQSIVIDFITIEPPYEGHFLTLD